MIRGRRALTVIRDVIRIAEKRGGIQPFRNEPDMLGNFMFPRHVGVTRERKLAEPVGSDDDVGAGLCDLLTVSLPGGCHPARVAGPTAAFWCRS